MNEVLKFLDLQHRNIGNEKHNCILSAGRRETGPLEMFGVFTVLFESMFSFKVMGNLEKKSMGSSV